MLVLSVGSFFSYVNDARSHEPEIFLLIS